MKCYSLDATDKLGGVRLYHTDACDFLWEKSQWEVDSSFLDPPFNIGHDYDGEGGKSDRKNAKDYSTFLTNLVTGCFDRVRPGGSLFFHLPDQHVAETDVLLQSLGGIRINWIILHQEFGQYRESNFIPSKVHLLYYCKPPVKKRTWNVEEILEPSLRMRVGDQRIKTAKFKGKRPYLDVWYGPYLGRVQGNNAERWNGHPNQLPEQFLAILLKATTKPGDTVLDCCAGSGTTGVVARALGRNFIGCEIQPKLAASAFKRIQKGPVRDVFAPYAMRGGL